MADTLEVNDLLAVAYEPKRKYRWIFSIDGLDAFTAKTFTRPQLTFDVTTIDYINTKRYLSGKATFNPITVTLNDPIAPSESQKVMEWIRLNYESVTGRAGYAAFYKKDFSLKLLDPVGTVVEQWTFQGAWIQDANFNELDYAVSDPADINLVIQYDSFILDF